MKRLIIIAATAVLSVTSWANSVKDVTINAVIGDNGSVRITEVWTLNQEGSGTEWYLVRNNLGDIDIVDFKVSENGRDFISEGYAWNTNRGLAEKAGRCGIVRNSKGMELCWGLGSYGDHVFTVSYTMTNVVKQASDYQYLHVQFVNSGLSSPPEHVKLIIKDGAGRAITDDNAKVWGFGYHGIAEFIDDGIYAESAEPFSSNSSMIILMRFDTGFYNTGSMVDETFEEHLEKAKEGSDFKSSDDDDDVSIFGAIIAGILGMTYLAKKSKESRNLKMTGFKKLKDIDWSREAPFSGDILLTNYVLSVLEPFGESGQRVAAAYILRMIEQEYLLVRKDGDDKIEIYFNKNKDIDKLRSSEAKLYNMMKEAAGSDEILQDREFSRWSKKNSKTVDLWVRSLTSDGLSAMMMNGYIKESKTTSDSGKTEAQKVIGFRKFLKEFTLVDERQSRDVGLWNNYLVFGALYGIADKVAKELRDIDPKILEQTPYQDPSTARMIIHMSNNLSNAITKAQARELEKASGGHGGRSSFGGGGGFSGGGHGGGAR